MAVQLPSGLDLRPLDTDRWQLWLALAIGLAALGLLLLLGRLLAATRRQRTPTLQPEFFPLPSTDEPGHTDRRVWVRQSADIKASCRPVSTDIDQPADTGWSATIRDISAGGVSLALCRRFEAGTALDVQLPAGAGARPSVVPVRVVHALPGPYGSWVIGCAFACKMTEEAVQELLHINTPPRPISGRQMAGVPTAGA